MRSALSIATVATAIMSGCALIGPSSTQDGPVKHASGVEWADGDWRICQASGCRRATPKTMMVMPSLPQPPKPATVPQPPAPVPLPAVVTQEPVIVNFPFNSATPVPGGMRVIEAAASRALGGAGKGMIRVIGYTDSLGVQKVNDVLAKRRARFVAGQLKRLGVKARIEIRGDGGCCYVAGNDTDEGRGANRRVEIHLPVNQD